MIYAKIHDYQGPNGEAGQTVAARFDQPDSSWEPYDVPDCSWLSVVDGKIVQAETAPIPPEPAVVTRPFFPLQKHSLQYKAVLIHCLSREMKYICYASGFICKEGSEYFLYTCWHVVTGYDPHYLRTVELPDRYYLKIYFQGVSRPRENTTILGGVQEITLALYDTSYDPPQPLWIQEDEETPNISLNSRNIHVPKSLDVVKIRLGNDLNIFDEQVIDRVTLFGGMPQIGEALYVVGFPFGFSVTGEGQPTPIVLSRFVASTFSTYRPGQILLDGAGAKGMSGGPVFSEMPGIGLQFLGIYTGAIWPDAVAGGQDKSFVLGTCCNLWTFEDDNIRKARFEYFSGK